MQNRHVPPTPIRRPQPLTTAFTIEDTVDKFERAGGNLNRFMLDYMGKESYSEQELLLYRIEQELDDPKNSELRVRWNNILEVSHRTRAVLLKNKMFTQLENWQNLSSSSSAATVAFCKHVNDICKEYGLAPASDEGQLTSEDDELAGYEQEFKNA